MTQLNRRFDDVTPLNALTLADGAPSHEAPSREAVACGDCEAERRSTSRRSYDQRLRDLNAIGLALSSERDIQKLLDLILEKSRELTQADAGSLYLVEKSAEGDSALLFHSSQNDSIALNTQNRTFAVSPSSLAGYAALSGEVLCFDDVYELRPGEPYKFNPDFDREHGYRTKSILVLPLKNHAQQVIGVLQLINRKRHRDAVLRDAAIVEREVMPFDLNLVELGASLASQAAVALENSRLLAEVQALLDEISDLFDSFVMAAADAIEGRDPATAGHSKRVTALTVGMALAASEATEGPFRDVEFSPQQIREVRYAGLLHDFGKIGVREHVLLKRYKIEPGEFAGVTSRFLVLRRAREAETAQCANEMLRAALDGTISRAGAEAQIAECEARLHEAVAEIDDALRLLHEANAPCEMALPGPQYEAQQCALRRIAAWTYPDANGALQPLLSSLELHALSVRRGNLMPDEYAQIQKHATFSYNFLKQIPWTEDLQQVPHIAHCHHEKLNGQGYPRHLIGDQIPLAARMMTVADIYDALTAAERPYKRALTRREALRILDEEAASGALDRDVLDLFIARKIYKITEGWGSGAIIVQ